MNFSRIHLDQMLLELVHSSWQNLESSIKSVCFLAQTWLLSTVHIFTVRLRSGHGFKPKARMLWCVFQVVVLLGSSSVQVPDGLRRRILRFYIFLSTVSRTVPEHHATTSMLYSFSLLPNNSTFLSSHRKTFSTPEAFFFGQLQILFEFEGADFGAGACFLDGRPWWCKTPLTLGRAPAVQVMAGLCLGGCWDASCPSERISPQLRVTVLIFVKLILKLCREKLPTVANHDQ